MVQVPADTRVSVLPLTVHTAGVPDANCTVRPELAVAARVGVVPMVWLPGDTNIIVCPTSEAATAKLCVTVVAAL